MSRLLRWLVLFSLLAMTLPVTIVAAQDPLPPPFDQCVPPMIPLYGQQSSGAFYFGCVPPLPNWNGDLVIFAHGYVAPNESFTKFLEQLILPDGNTIPGLTLSMGYAFATTSYSENGLAVQQGIADILDLITVFDDLVGAPNHIYLVGASEGGLVTTLAIERHPDAFTGGLATCACSTSG